MKIVSTEQKAYIWEKYLCKENPNFKQRVLLV